MEIIQKLATPGKTTDVCKEIMQREAWQKYWKVRGVLCLTEKAYLDEIRRPQHPNIGAAP